MNKINQKPFSSSCERNWKPILEVMQKTISSDSHHLFEVGSGTGQHAVYLSPYFKNLEWIASDRAENISGINLWIQDGDFPNIRNPIEFEVGKNQFPKDNIDIIYTANTFHIMPWKKVKKLIQMMGNKLKEDSLIMIYGPFNYNGQYTSESNAQFDSYLKSMDPLMGIRDFEKVEKEMNQSGFYLKADNPMPSNNRFLIFKTK